MKLKYISAKEIKLNEKFEIKKKSKDSSGFGDEFLMNSIKEVGMIEPLIVREDKKGYTLIDGYRRYRQLINLHKIDKLHSSLDIDNLPCIVNDDPEKSDISVRVESFNRQNLTPSQEAYYYRVLIKEHSVTRSNLAKMIGISEMSISNYLIIGECIKQVVDAIDSGLFPMSASKIFSPLKDEGQIELYGRVKDIKSVTRQILVREQRSINDSKFKKSIEERSQISKYLRNAKKGQIQEKPLVREVLNLSLKDVSDELSDIKISIQDIQMVIDKFGPWWCRVVSNKSILKMINDFDSDIPKNVLNVIEVEGFDLNSYA